MAGGWRGAEGAGVPKVTTHIDPYRSEGFVLFFFSLGGHGFEKV